MRNDGEDGVGSLTNPGVCECCGAKEGFVMDYVTGEVTCTRCGTVQTDSIISLEPEWRAFGTEHQRRIRAKVIDLKRSDKGIGTVLRVSRRDAKGAEIDSDRRYDMRRWEAQDKKSKVSSSRDRHFANAMNCLNMLCDRLKANNLRIPKDIVQETARQYEKVYQSGITRGRTVKSLVAATLYLVCRQNHQAVTLTDISDASECTKKELASAYRTILWEVRPDVPQHDTRPFIGKLCIQLKLRGEIERRALEILEMAEKEKIIAGKDPKGLAAAIVYITMKEFEMSPIVTQGVLAMKSGVTEVTIRNRYKQLCKELGLLKSR